MTFERTTVTGDRDCSRSQAKLEGSSYRKASISGLVMTGGLQSKLSVLTCNRHGLRQSCSQRSLINCATLYRSRSQMKIITSINVPVYLRQYYSLSQRRMHTLQQLKPLVHTDQPTKLHLVASDLEVLADVDVSLGPALTRCHALVVVVLATAEERSQTAGTSTTVSTVSISAGRSGRSATSGSVVSVATSGCGSLPASVASTSVASRRGSGGSSCGCSAGGIVSGVGAPFLSALAFACVGIRISSVSIGISSVAVSTGHGALLDLLGNLLVGGLVDRRVRVQDGLGDVGTLLGDGTGVLVALDGGREVLLVLSDLGHDALQRLGRLDVGRVVVCRQRLGVCLLDGDTAAEVIGVLAADGAHVSLG